MSDLHREESFDDAATRFVQGADHLVEEMAAFAEHMRQYRLHGPQILQNTSVVSQALTDTEPSAESLSAADAVLTYKQQVLKVVGWLTAHRECSYAERHRHYQQWAEVIGKDLYDALAEL